MSIKQKICILFAMLFVVLSAGCGSSKTVNSNDYLNNANVQMWIEDIDYLHKNLPKSHKNIYHSISKKKFDKEIQDLKNDAPKLKDYEIKCRLSQIVASIGDAHTSLIMDYNNKYLYPIEIQWFNKDLRVVATDKLHKDVLGKKLVSINGISIDKVMKKIDSLISHENSQWLKEIDIEYIMMPEVLKLFGTNSEDGIEFSFQDDQNNVSKIQMYPNNFEIEDKVTIMDEMPAKPLRLQYDTSNINESLYWYKYIPKDKIFYFQYNQCIDRNVAKQYGYSNYENYPDFSEFLNRLLQEISNDDIDKFIVDLRDNAGGDSSLMTELVTKLANINKLNGKIYVIIGRGTFSSGVFAAVDFMKYTKAKFYGEPSGGNVNGYGEVKCLELPNSKLKISYSTKYFNISDKFKQNFVPDVICQESFSDFKSGVDDAYEAIKNGNK